jgi:TolB-like protein
LVHHTFKFGAFAFDAGRSQLMRGGQVVAIGQRAAAILARLLEANGSVVGKDDLFAAAWPGQVVEESNLSVQIAALRKALGQNAMGEDWITTAQRMGYSLAVEPAKGSKALQDSGSDGPSIAVLPFGNSSGEAGQDFFADGLTEDVITDLSNVPGFRVIARNSTLVYKGKPTDVRQIAEDLGVTHVVEGSMRKSADRVRVNVQLVDATSGTHIWAERFDRELADVFALQDEVARRIVAAISGKLSVPSLRKRPQSVEAYELCLRCRYMIAQSKEANEEAQRFLLRAIALEPGYSEAHRRLSHAYSFHWLHYDGDQAMYRAQSLALAERAVELDPQDSGNYWALAWVQAYERQPALAHVNFAKAKRLNPNDADACAMYADFLAMEGRPEEAVQSIKEGLRLNPRPAGWYFWLLGQALVQLGRYEEAIDALNREETYRSSSRRVLAVALWKLGRAEEAKTEAALFKATAPNARTSFWTKTRPFRNPKDLKFWADAFKEVGLPD